MADYVIGIDAGGTHTDAAAYALPEPSGTVWAAPEPIVTTASGCGNLALDPESAADSIVSAASEVVRLMRERGFGVCRRILCGAAGSTSAVEGVSAAEFCRKRLLPLCEAVSVVSDGEMALIAAFGKTGDGLLVVSGTGSIVYLRKDGKLTRAGGWGHLLGDGGSGFSVAQTALKRLLSGVDSGSPDVELEEAVFRFLGIRSYPELISFVYGKPKSALAALAPTIENLAEAGNSEALDALRQSAGELAEDALRLLGRIDKKQSSLPLCLSGGCFEHLPLLRRFFLERLEEASPVPLSVTPTPPPTAAVLRLTDCQL